MVRAPCNGLARKLRAGDCFDGNRVKSVHYNPVHMWMRHEMADQNDKAPLDELANRLSKARDDAGLPDPNAPPQMDQTQRGSAMLPVPYFTGV